MKRMLYGTPEAPPDKQTAAELASEILRTELLELLLRNLSALPFECRKEATQVCKSAPTGQPSSVASPASLPELVLRRCTGRLVGLRRSFPTYCASTRARSHLQQHGSRHDRTCCSVSHELPP